MPKTLRLLLCAVLMLLFVSSAGANSWGLKGKLLTAVSRDRQWNDYMAVSSQAGDFAVMGTQYHNALMLLDEAGELRVYTTAVYQPQEKIKTKPRLKLEGKGFHLQYGESDFYFEPKNGEYCLTRAKHGDITLEYADEYRYSVKQGAETACFVRDITLKNFNISLFPRTLDEVAHLNKLHAELSSGQYVWGRPEYQTCYNDLGNGTKAVYGAPEKNAWRAAKGKAAVALGSEVWVLGQMENAQGEAYVCVRYEVSQRTQRVGFVKRSDVRADFDCLDVTDSFLNMPVKTIAKTYLTDDPECSQYQQFTLKKGTELTCLGTYDEDYALVTYQSGSGTVWGFVPLRDIETDKGAYANVQHDAMQRLAGKWAFAAGGSLGPEYMELRADGTCTAHEVQGDDEGVRTEEYTWQLTRYNPDWKLYGSGAAYEMTLFSLSDHTVSVNGVELTDTGFGLTDGEGSGSYMRAENLTGE